MNYLKVSHLKVFGCGAFVYLPNETRKGKLQPKLQLMIYLGVSAGSKHNYLFMQTNNALYISAHAIFDEHLFPRCSGAWPHKPVSHPLQKPHDHTKDQSNHDDSDDSDMDDLDPTQYLKPPPVWPHSPAHLASPPPAPPLVTPPHAP